MAVKTLSVFYALFAASSAGYIPTQWYATPTLPLNEVQSEQTGPSPLPTPTGSPQYVALGLGFQNYTCASSTTSTTLTYVQTQSSGGAIANLYNLQYVVNSYDMDSITPTALENFEKCVSKTQCNPATNNDCQSCHSMAVGPLSREQIGEHFFEPVNGAQTPSFSLSSYSKFLSAKKVGDVKAESNAYKGETGLGAVDWLYLQDNGDGLTSGLSAVYRVETAGGVAPPSCSTSGSAMYVPYAAQYWFY